MKNKRYEIIIPELYNEIRHRRDYLMKIISRFVLFYCGITGWMIAYTPQNGKLKTLLVVFTALLTVWGLQSVASHLLEYSRIAKVIVNMNEKIGMYEDDIFPASWRSWGTSKMGYFYYLGTIALSSIIAIFSILVSN